jgi:hypothetical protein
VSSQQIRRERDPQEAEQIPGDQPCAYRQSAADQRMLRKTCDPLGSAGPGPRLDFQK